MTISILCEGFAGIKYCGFLSYSDTSFGRPLLPLPAGESPDWGSGVERFRSQVPAWFESRELIWEAPATDLGAVRRRYAYGSWNVHGALIPSF
ncbi:hypothetical protein Y032_0027g1542 [Ancylostoma ceylanicum]|nr:hypothetical protein Y032_0027g1542 [Ancylostoma ceylanicum]